MNFNNSIKWERMIFCSDTQRWLFTRILHARWRDINIEMFPSLYILPGTEDLGVTEVRTLLVSVIMRYETWTRDGAEKLWLSTQFLLLIIRLESPLCLRARPTPSFASRLCPSVLYTMYSVLYCTVLYCGPRSGLCLSLPGDNEAVTERHMCPSGRAPGCQSLLEILKTRHSSPSPGPWPSSQPLSLTYNNYRVFWNLAETRLTNWPQSVRDIDTKMFCKSLKWPSR